MWEKIVVSQKKYYTYTLAYPEEMEGHVFYVGKGTGDRMLEHEIEAKKGSPGRKCDTIREIWAKGYEVQKSIVYETDIEQDALIYEWAGINMIWTSPHLTNFTANVYGPELRREYDEKERRRFFAELAAKQEKYRLKKPRIETCERSR